MDYKEKVIDIISELSVVSDNEIDTKDKFSDIGVDSIKFVELILNLEDKLNIKFDDGELDPSKLITVKNILELTEKYVLAGI